MIAAARLSRLFLWALFLLSVTTLLVNSATTGIFYDEAFTYHRYVGDFVSGERVSPFKFDTLNNHLINSLLLHITHTLYPWDEFVMRLPSVFMFALYFIGCIRFSRITDSKVIAPLVVLFMLFDPMIIAYFATARGYGPALAFQMIALGLLLNAWQKYHNKGEDIEKSLCLVVGCCALAAWSNFSFVYFSVPTTILCAFIWLFHTRRNATHVSASRAQTSIRVFAVVAALSHLLIPSLAKQALSGDPHTLWGVGGYALKSMFIRTFEDVWLFPISINVNDHLPAILVVGVLSWVAMQWIVNRKLLLFGVLFLLVVGMSWGYAKVAQVSYPIGRSGLFLVPVLYCAICESLLSIAKRDSFNILKSTTLFAAALYLISGLIVFYGNLFDMRSRVQGGTTVFFDVINNYERHIAYQSGLDGTPKRTAILCWNSGDSAIWFYARQYYHYRKSMSHYLVDRIDPDRCDATQVGSKVVSATGERIPTYDPPTTIEKLKARFFRRAQ